MLTKRKHIKGTPAYPGVRHKAVSNYWYGTRRYKQIIPVKCQSGDGVRPGKGTHREKIQKRRRASSALKAAYLAVLQRLMAGDDFISVTQLQIAYQVQKCCVSYLLPLPLHPFPLSFFPHKGPDGMAECVEHPGPVLRDRGIWTTQVRTLVESKQWL